MLITGVHVCSAANEILRSGDEAVIRISGTSTVPLREVRFGIRIEDVIGNYIAGTNSFLINRQDVCLDAGAFTADFTLPITMGAGHYLVTVAIHRDSEVLCWIDSATEFDVEAPLAPYREGMVDIAARVSIASER
jgi:hypothetical protein